MKTKKVCCQSAKRLALSVCLGVATLLGANLSHAERVTIPLGQQGQAWNVETPRTGLRKDQVEQHYGAPLSRSGPVGDPPIYTWDYGDFLVYFEGDYVIHSVVKHQPENS